MEQIIPVPLSDDGDQRRISCKNCGKLLFKLTNKELPQAETGSSYRIEIKCHNRSCKTINIINL